MSVESLRHEHREWNREHVFWLEDLERWKVESEEARQVLKRADLRLRDGEKAWEEHREAMVAMEQKLARHDKHLEHREGCDEAAEHQSQRALQAEQRVVHQGLAQRHQAIMTAVHSLEQLLLGT